MSRHTHDFQKVDQFTERCHCGASRTHWVLCPQCKQKTDRLHTIQGHVNVYRGCQQCVREEVDALYDSLGRLRAIKPEEHR